MPKAKPRDIKNTVGITTIQYFTNTLELLEAKPRSSNC